MKTRITEMFGIEHPLLLSGMSWISDAKLVAAVSEAGGLGILATGILNPDQSRQAIHDIRKLTSKPFAANVTLYFPGAERNAKILIEEKVPVVNYSLGKGDWICKAVHEYGGKVVATVATLKHALAAQKDGADALIVTGSEAAGHAGEVSSLTLIPAVKEIVQIPIIAAGGFADGRGLIAALVMGAEGIAMGTRFMNSVESPVHESQKKISNEQDAFCTVFTNKVDGLGARVMKSEGTTRLMKKHLNPLSALFKSKEIAKMLGFPWLKLAIGILFSGMKKALLMARMVDGFKAFERATLKGDNKKGVLPLGQVTGIIHSTLTVKEIIDNIINEAENIRKQISNY